MPGDGEISFEAEIIQPELSGMDWVIHCKKDDIKFSCRSNDSLSPGTTQKFSLSISDLHYFDEKGARLDL